MPMRAPRRAASGSIRRSVRARMVRAPARATAASRRAAARAGGRAAPSVPRHRVGGAGLRRHQSADRPRANDLQALGGGAHDLAAAGGAGGARTRRAGQGARDRHRLRLPGARCWRSLATRWFRSSALARCSTRRASIWRRCALDRCAWCTATGVRGHAPNAPYDSIIAAAGADEPAAAWLEQLAVGGRLVAPVRRGARGGRCWWLSIARASGTTRRSRGSPLRPSKIRRRLTCQGHRILHPKDLARRVADVRARWCVVALACAAGRLRHVAPTGAGGRARPRSPPAPRRHAPRRDRARSGRARAPRSTPSRSPAPRTPASPATTPSSRATR